MHSFKLWFITGFAASVIAKETGASRQSRVVSHLPRDLPAIKRSIQALSKDAAALNKEIKSITSANAAAQIETINKQLQQISTTMTDQTKKLSASGELKTADALSVLNSKAANEWTTLITEMATSVTSALTGLQDKKDIIKSSGKVDSLSPGLRATGKGIVEFVDAIIISQVPAALKTPLGIGGKNGKGSAFGTSKPLIEKTVNNFIDQGINYLKGTQDTFTVPSDILPAGLTITYSPGAASSGASSGGASSSSPAPKAPAAGKGKSQGKGKKMFVD